MPDQRTRKLVAILFTDIVGYTALMQKDEEAAFHIRSRHREVFEKLHASYHGEIIQYYGDGTLSIFTSAIEAVECAIEIQRQLQEGDPKVQLRTGLHLGDIVYSATEVYGDGINVASRIESMCIPGAVFISGKLNDELKNHRNITSKSLGKFDLKNIAQPVDIFYITNEGLTVPTGNELLDKFNRIEKSIAVLPFINMSSSVDNEYFSDGMTEEIINALTRIKGLKVTSRTSSFYFKNKPMPISEIGRELNVTTILEGSIRLAGKQMRITAQLIDVKADQHFWSETFDRSVDDIFSVQDEISLKIADRLREHVGHLDIGEHLVDAPGVPPAIYQQYLKGRYHILKMNRQDIEEGQAILQNILREFPDFALAQLGMHLGFALLGTLGLMPAAEAFAFGKPYLDKAIELDEKLPECQLNLAWNAFLQKWDVPAAYQHLQNVLEVRPVADYYQSMACVLVAEGKFKAAMQYIETSFELDPFSPINFHLKGFIFYSDEKYEEAIDQFQKGAELQPGFRVSILHWGQALLMLGRTNEALTFFQNLPDDRDDLHKPGGTTLTYAKMGDLEKAQVGILKLEEFLHSDLMERAMNLLILCHTALGQKENALRLIEQGIEYRLPLMVYINIEPMLGSLHQNPGFHELMTKVFKDVNSA